MDTLPRATYGARWTGSGFCRSSPMGKLKRSKSHRLRTRKRLRLVQPWSKKAMEREVDRSGPRHFPRHRGQLRERAILDSNQGPSAPEARLEQNQAGPDSPNGPSQSEFRALSEVSGTPEFPAVPGFPAVPPQNVDKTCGQTGRLSDEPGYWALLTVSEVAELLRVSKATVYGLIDRKVIPSVRVSNAIRVRREAVDELLR